MKILFVGNQGNTGYRIVKWLNQAGVDATLLFPYNFNHSRSFPEWEDPQLKGRYPSWILTYRETRWPYLFLNPKIKKMARQYDLILTTGFLVLPVLRVNKPVVFLPAGRDLSQMPFWSGKLVARLHGLLYSRRIHKVRAILSEQEDCVWSARLLGVGDRVYRFPFLTDMDGIEQGINEDLRQQLLEKYRDYECIFFNPTRKNMDPGRMDYKGVDKLLMAYRRFMDLHPDKPVVMVSGLHGLHPEAFREKVRQLGLESYMEYTGHLTLPDLHAWLSLEKVVVFDQFSYNLNALGGLQREAMALGRLVVSSTDIRSREFVKAYGAGCPLIPAFDQGEIVAAMEKVAYNGSLEKTVDTEAGPDTTVGPDREGGAETHSGPEAEERFSDINANRDSNAMQDRETLQDSNQPLTGPGKALSNNKRPLPDSARIRHWLRQHVHYENRINELIELLHQVYQKSHPLK